jgi:hypothetical protein
MENHQSDNTMKKTKEIQKLNENEMGTIFFAEEENWYYDELELIWKRNPASMTLNRILSFASPSTGNFLSLQAGR